MTALATIAHRCVAAYLVEPEPPAVVIRRRVNLRRRRERAIARRLGVTRRHVARVLR